MSNFEIKRELDLSSIRNSIFLFGPRQTGKTTLLKSLKSKHYFDLLDYDYETSLKANPKLFWEEISAIPDRSLVIIDEIQKIPELLNYVQKAMDQKKIRFFLSGSSARKLKRGAANLLGGRALDLRFHPLSLFEMDRCISLSQILSFGSLPHIYNCA